MKRILALLLTVVMMFGAIAIDISAVAVPDIWAKNSEGKDIVGQVDYEETLKQYLTVKFANEREKLETMEKMYESDGYEIWVDTYTGEVATVNVATGQILFSNPYDIGTKDKEPADAIKADLFSQIIVKYTDNDTDKTMNSFTEAASRGQINFEYIKNGIRVEYSIGREETRMLVPRIIERTRFEENILQPFADEINKISEENGYLFVEWRNYLPMALRNKMIEASSPTGNQKDGNTEWFKFVKLLAFYSEKFLGEAETEKERQSMKALYPICTKMDIWVCTPDISRNELITVEGYIKTYIPSYTFEQLEYDHNLTEYSGQDKAPPLFKMALEYTLDEWGMSVRLPANGLRFDESLYQLTYVSILPYMGAGANYHLDNKEDTYTGYNLFPDGAGTLFRHEDLVDKAQTVVNGKVYGQDYAYNTIVGANQQVIRYPVFGIVSNTHRTEQIKVEQATTEETVDANGNVIIVDKEGNVVSEHIYEEVLVDNYVEEDKGFVAIIEEGDALAELSDYHMGSSGKYNTVQMLFYPRPKDSYNLANAISVGANASWTVVSSRKYVGNYKIRYIMLTDDAIAQEKGITDYYECTWVGMAEAYRDYLYETGRLDALEEKDVQEDIPMYIETFGTLETLEKIMSIPVNVMTSLTSFENVKTMYDELSAEGVKNIKFKLNGYANGGMYSSVPYKLEWEKSVGGDKGYEDLLDYSAEKGFEVFPEFNFVYTRQDQMFDGLTLKNHIVKSINDTYMSRRYYSATRQTHVGRFELAISSAYYNHFYDKLTENLLKNYENSAALKAISVSTLGTELNSDFDEDEPYNREDAKKHTQALFESMREDYDLVMTEGANAYTWKYVDYIINAPLDSSRYNMSANAVPFIGVVLHGSVEFAGTPLNMEGNIGYSMLKAIENGAGLYFVLCYENYEELKEDMRLSEYYSVRYDILKSDVIKYYTVLNDLTKDLQLQKIVGHQFLIGERIPDADEVIADEEALKKEEEIANKLAEELAAKKLQESLLEGRVYAATVSKTASDEINKIYDSINAYYDGAVTVNAKGVVTPTIGMNTLVKDALAKAALKAPLEDAYELANAWTKVYNIFNTNIKHTGSNKVYSEFLTTWNGTQTSLNNAINAVAEKEAALETAFANAVAKKLSMIPTLVKAYDAAVASGTGADAALANIINFVGSLEDAIEYAEALDSKAAAEEAITTLKNSLTQARISAQSAYEQAQKSIGSTITDADYLAKKASADAVKLSLSTNEIVLDNLKKLLNTISISYPDSVEHHKVIAAIAEYEQKIIDTKAAIKAANNEIDAYHLAKDASFAALKSAYEDADAALENYTASAEYLAQDAIIKASEQTIESLGAKIEVSVKAAYEKIVSDYTALTDAQAKVVASMSAMENAVVYTAEYTNLIKTYAEKKIALQKVLDSYLEQADYKDIVEKLTAPIDAKIAELTAKIKTSNAEQQIKLATEILNLMNLKYTKVTVPKKAEGDANYNILLQVDKNADGLVIGAGYIENDYITKYQKAQEATEAYKTAKAELDAAQAAINTYKNTKTGPVKSSAEYVALKTQQTENSKAINSFKFDNDELKNALTQLVTAKSTVVTQTTKDHDAKAQLDAVSYYTGIENYTKVLEAYEAALAPNPNIIVEYSAALKAYNTAFGAVKGHITTVTNFFKSLNTQANTLNNALANSVIAKEYYNRAEFKGVYSDVFLSKLEGVYTETRANVKAANEVVDKIFAKFIETLELAKAIIPNTSTDFELTALRVEIKDDGTVIVPEYVEPEEEVTEEEEEEEKEPEYEYTKYTDDSGNIVYIEYANGTYFILNYNYYSVSVVFDGVTHTLARYGGVKVIPGNEPIYFETTTKTN